MAFQRRWRGGESVDAVEGVEMKGILGMGILERMTGNVVGIGKRSDRGKLRERESGRCKRVLHSFDYMLLIALQPHWILYFNRIYVILGV